jgi:molybdopterin synthase catalytic subunit
MEASFMRVTVLFFGILKDLVGRSQEQLELPAGARLETVFDHYASQFPKLRQMAGSVVIARNHEFAKPDAVVGEGDEVALMPPVSGGSAAGPDGGSKSAAAGAGGRSPWLACKDQLPVTFYALTRQTIDTRVAAAKLLAGEDGALITFEGVVRNHSRGRRSRYLDYECYVPLALKKMEEIGADILKNHEVRGIAMIHRLGRLEIGETSVAILVASAHRKPAYEASLEAINRLKRLVPIWKKEYFEDGEIWVEGEWESSLPTPAGTPR